MKLCEPVPQAQQVQFRMPSPTRIVQTPTMGVMSNMRAWTKKYANKDVLAKLGIDAFFTYGFVSNVNAGITIALAWGTFTRASGLSPLAPEQWSKFLAVYVGIYATLGTVLRPFRLAIAVGMTPGFSAIVKRLQTSMPFYGKRPKLARTAALVIVSFLGNICVTCGVAGLGIYISSVFTGVPVFPAGYRFRS